METVQLTQKGKNSLKGLIKELAPIISFFARFSLYGISLALLLGFFLIGGLIIFSKIG
ncbi:MAG: hypothetical protein RBU23_11375 [Candidatus Auribacterota bacterium]|jgi:hypothetical protein|nr:hypothetical protein [Candidatus Auribacterota bacterium]